MRLVKLTVIYDMDDPAKSLEAELNDWLEGHVNVQDLGCKLHGEDKGTVIAFDGEITTITMKEV